LSDEIIQLTCDLSNSQLTPEERKQKERAKERAREKQEMKMCVLARLVSNMPQH